MTSRKTLAQAAADYLREWNDGLDTDDDQDWSLDCSMTIALYEIYRASSCKGNKRKPSAIKNAGRLPALTNRSVLDALAKTREGRELFECRRIPALYPFITNGIIRIFVLRPKYRHLSGNGGI